MWGWWRGCFFGLACLAFTTASGAAQQGPTSTPGPVPTPTIPPRVDGPSGVVALTFDAGADRGYAEDILDTLADEQVPATFGVTGRLAEANPDLVERMAGDGHLVIKH